MAAMRGKVKKRSSSRLLADSTVQFQYRCLLTCCSILYFFTYLLVVLYNLNKSNHKFVEVSQLLERLKIKIKTESRQGSRGGGGPLPNGLPLFGGGGRVRMLFEVKETNGLI